jgi:hypothetical protein
MLRELRPAFDTLGLPDSASVAVSVPPHPLMLRIKVVRRTLGNARFER